MECLVRNFDIRTINLTMPNLGQLSEGDEATEPSIKQLKTERDMTETSVNSKNNSETTQEADMDTVENDSEHLDEDNKDNDKSDTEAKSDGNKTKNMRHDMDLIGKKDDRSFFFKTAAPSTKMPGHTGFLTFATLYPT